MAPVIWGSPIPSPIKKITFLGLVRAESDTDGGGAATSRAGVQAVTNRRRQRMMPRLWRLPDSHKLFAGKRFDGSLKFEGKEDGCKFTRSCFGFKS